MLQASRPPAAFSALAASPLAAYLMLLGGFLCRARAQDSVDMDTGSESLVFDGCLQPHVHNLTPRILSRRDHLHLSARAPVWSQHRVHLLLPAAPGHQGSDGRSQGPVTAFFLAVLFQRDKPLYH